MRLPEKEQTFLYDTYWSKIENLFRGSEKTFDAFVRDYIALFTKASKQEKTGNIYFAFRRMFNLVSNSQEFKLDVFLQKLHKFARYHAAFSIGTDAPDWLREPFAHLRRQVDVPATLVMRLFECYDHGTLSADQFVTAIGLLDSYVFRSLTWRIASTLDVLSNHCQSDLLCKERVIVLLTTTNFAMPWRSATFSASACASICSTDLRIKTVKSRQIQPTIP